MIPEIINSFFMQNIDFSKKIQAENTAQRNSGSRTPVQAGMQSGAAGSSRSGSLWMAALIALSLAYGAGVWSGLKIGGFAGIEKNLVKYPDTAKKEDPEQKEASRLTSSFSNVPLDADPGTGNYIIFIGSFSPEKAALAANRLNNHPELAGFRPMRCAKIKESVPGRYSAFRTRSRDDSAKQDVFVGCFPGEDAASEVLSVIQESGIQGVSEARIFSIE